jgi:hypothetical protein
MNNLIKYFFGVMKEQTKNKNNNNNNNENENDNDNENENDLDYRKIKNYLRKHSSTIADDYELRLKLQKLFYYGIDDIPIAILKTDDEIYKNDNFPYYFQNKTREEIIKIYNKEVKTKFLIKIYNKDELNDYNIKENIYLDISLKTFRPVYNDNWKKISEEINEVSFDKQKSFYADYLRYHLKYKHFPSFEEFIKFIYDRYQMPVHKDIKIVFKNIHKSYDNVKDYIRNNKMSSSDVNKIIKLSTSIPNRIMIENF